jgi:hypothetical protein
MRIRALIYLSLLTLVAATPPPSPPQGSEISSIVNAAIARMNQNDAVGLRSFFADDATIIDEIPPFRWSGLNASAAWLSSINASSAEDGLHTYSRAGIELVGFANDSARYDAPFDLSLSKTRRTLVRGEWSFLLTRVGGAWKIEYAIWTVS